jgi:pimeloyl-ACP methyl ester carboxylesterase
VSEVTSAVSSKDGTRIAFTRSGSGSPVVLVNGALGGQQASSALAGRLAAHFSVLGYDRRGRGESGNAAKYAVDREIEDLAAVIEAAGGSAFVYGTSSGGNLALAGAARDLGITRLALWEPNFLVDDSRPPLPADYVEHVNALVSSGHRGDAVEYFLTVAAGVPAQFVAPMRGMPTWPFLEAAAHSLAYDGAVVGDGMSGRPLAKQRWTAVVIPTLVIDGGTAPWLSHGADALANALPNAERRTLPGQAHDVSADAIAPLLTEFFGGRR